MTIDSNDHRAVPCLPGRRAKLVDAESISWNSDNDPASSDIRGAFGWLTRTRTITTSYANTCTSPPTAAPLFEWLLRPNCQQENPAVMEKYPPRKGRVRATK